MKPRYVVAIYELDRAYGGPEEGGWWYDTGELVRIHSIENSKDAAYTKCRRINNLLDYKRRNQDRRTRRYPIGSVCYDGGHYEAAVYEHTAPLYFPEQRPYYE